NGSLPARPASGLARTSSSRLMAYPRSRHEPAVSRPLSSAPCRNPEAARTRSRNGKQSFIAVQSMEHSSFRSDCLRGHTILITGGAGAIGRVVTQALAHHGARVAVNDIHPQEEGERIIGRDKSISYFSADITNEKDVAQLFDAVEEALDVPTVVCCHAGVVESSAYTDLSVRNFERTLDVNLKGAFL